MLVNRFALLAATLSCISVCWATYPNLEAMLDNSPPDAIIAPNGVPLITAINALPRDMQICALQSLSPLADGSLMVASNGSMRQFYEAIDDRLRKIPPLCKDVRRGPSGISSGDPTAHTVEAAIHPSVIRTATAKTPTQTAINADPVHSPLNPTIHKIEPSVQKVLLESWAEQPGSQNHTATAKKESDLAKKEADLAKKEAELTKKEADAKAGTKESTDTKDAKDSKTTAEHPKDAKDAKPGSSAKTVALAGTPAADSTSTSDSKKSDLENAYRCNGVWAQILGSSIDQKIRDQVLGYDAHLWGLNIGRDYEVAPNASAGAAIGYQQARTYSDVYSGSFFDVKRFQLSAYGRYDYLCSFYTQWALTGAFNRYDIKRKILVLPSTDSTEIANIAHGIFTGWEYDVYLEEGFTWTYCDYQINPKLFLTFTHLTPEGYFEKDALNLGLSVKYENMDLLNLAGGFKFTYQAQFEKAFVVPEAHIYYFVNVINDKQFGRATFINFDNAFYAQGVTPQDASCEVGGALAVHSTKYVMVKLAYDLYWNSDYHRRQGYIQARYEFA